MADDGAALTTWFREQLAVWTVERGRPTLRVAGGGFVRLAALLAALILLLAFGVRVDVIVALCEPRSMVSIGPELYAAI